MRESEPEGRRSGGRVAIVSGMGGNSGRYRCTYKAEQLALAGMAVDVFDRREVDYRDIAGRYDWFVLHRVAWRPALAGLLRRARSKRAAVLYDVDDYLFAPEAADLVAFATHRPDEERRRKLERQALTLRACDGATFSTAPLADLARPLNPNVAVLPNAVGVELVRQADAAVSQARDAATVTLGYFSGTATHDRDFLEAADAVLDALETFPDVRFLAAGKIVLDDRFTRFGSRVERAEHRPYDRLAELVARADVNLVPLQHDNVFTTCKSCIKYLEAGLVGVPTVASAVADYARAIRHGENGFLARSREDWRAAVFRLVEDERLRREVGGRAFEDVRAHHTTRARAAEHAAVLADLIERVRPGRAAAAGAVLSRASRLARRR